MLTLYPIILNLEKRKSTETRMISLPNTILRNTETTDMLFCHILKTDKENSVKILKKKVLI